MYHSLDESGSVISVTPSRFAEHARILAESGRPVVPLPELTNVPGAVALTFDDGAKNFATAALPVLEKFALPATVFVVAGKVGGTNDWEPAGSPFPRLPLMGWSELAALPSQLVSLGAHSVTHADLTVLPEEQLDAEVAAAQRVIAESTGREVDTFAYPFGHSNARVRAVVERHYSLACGTELREVNAQCDRFLLPRIDAYYFREARRFARFVEGGGAPYLFMRRALRQLRRRLA